MSLLFRKRFFYPECCLTLFDQFSPKKSKWRNLQFFTKIMDQPLCKKAKKQSSFSVKIYRQNLFTINYDQFQISDQSYGLTPLPKMQILQFFYTNLMFLQSREAIFLLTISPNTLFDQFAREKSNWRNLKFLTEIMD